MCGKIQADFCPKNPVAVFLSFSVFLKIFFPNYKVDNVTRFACWNTLVKPGQTRSREVFREATEGVCYVLLEEEPPFFPEIL